MGLEAAIVLGLLAGLVIVVASLGLGIWLARWAWRKGGQLPVAAAPPASSQPR